MGSPLTAAPNFAIGCNSYPFPDVNGSFSLYNPSAVFGTVIRDCTWRQAGVFGVPNDTRFSSVPGDGRITSFSVRSGPNPSPLRLVIMRQLATPGFGAEGQCCFFVSETAEVQPAPNAISTFTTNVPVQRNVINGFYAIDIVALSARAGAGALPLATVGSTNLFNQFTTGSVNAGFFYPRIGSVPNDVGGGRREEGMPGVELLLQWTWCPAGQNCSAGGGGGGGGGSGGSGNTSVGPLLNNQNARVVNDRARIETLCNGNAVCRGLLELLPLETRSNPAKVIRYGKKKKFNVKPGMSKKVRVLLNRRGKRYLKNSEGTAQATLRMTPEGGSPVWYVVTLSKR